MRPASRSQRGSARPSTPSWRPPIAYAIVWYCGRRLDAFPRVHPAGQHRLRGAGRGDHLRADRRRPAAAAFGLFALPAVRQRHPHAALDGLRRPVARALPGPQLCRDPHDLDRDDAGAARPAAGSISTTSSRAGMRVDAIVADLGADLADGQLAALADAAIAGVPGPRPALHRRVADRPHAARRTDAQRVRRPAAVAPVPRASPRRRARPDRAGAAAAVAGAGGRRRRGAHRQPRAGVLRPVARRAPRPRVPHDQVPHDVSRRRRAELHRGGRPARHPRRRTSCAAAGSTSCRSSSTSCAAT